MDNVAEEEDNTSGVRTRGYNRIKVKLMDNFESKGYIIENSKVYNNYKIEQDWIYYLNRIIFQYMRNFYTLLERNCNEFSEMINEFAILWKDCRDIMNNFYVKWI